MKKKLQFLFSMVVLMCASVAVHAQVDITKDYLTNANLGTIDAGWNYYSDAFKYTDWKTDGDVSVVEFYSNWTSSPQSITQKDFKFSQTITLPAGDYRIAVNAFYRNGNGDGTNEDKAWIFAGEKKQNVAALSSAGVASYIGDNDLYRAANAFSLGDFSNAFDFTLEEETTLDVGFQGFFNLSLSWCILGPVKLYKYTLDAYITDYNNTAETAEALYDKPMNATVLQAMKDAIVDVSGYTKSAEIQAAIQTLNDAISAANNSIAEYAIAKAAIDTNAEKTATLNEREQTIYNALTDKFSTAYTEGTLESEEIKTLSTTLSTAFTAAKAFDEEIASAKALGIDVSAYETTEFTDAAEVFATIETLNVTEYTQVNADYTQNAASLIPDFADWEGGMVSNKGEHWDDTSTSTYYEQTSAQWGQGSWTNNKKTTVNLPKGKYVLYAAGRSETGTNCIAYIKVNNEERIFPSKGAEGFGVAIDGTASFDPTTATFANGNKGRGFEYRYIAFEVTADEGEDIALEIGGEATANHQWISFTAPVLLTTANNGAIAKKVLAADLATAQAVVEAKAGVGEDLFMIPTEAFETFEAAVNEAKAVNDKAGATTAEVEAAREALIAATEAYNNTPVNAPDPTKQYAFQLSGTSLYMNLADGIKIQEEATPLSFVAAANANQYYLDAEGELSVGLEGTNNWTMSTAADKRTACSFTALGNGEYHINNAKGLVGTDNTTLGSSCYANKTTSNNVVWVIKEVSAANISVKAGKWGTFVAPFDVTIPEGVKAYTVTGVEDAHIVTEETTETIPANTPVVLLNETENDIDKTVTGVGLTESETVKEGLLTGIYQAGADIPAGSYVLQTQEDKAGQAFYQVKETFAGQGVANRCYLTMPTGSAPLRAIFFGSEEGTTGIEAAEATDAEDGILYNLAGQKVDASYKGIVVKKGKAMLKK